MADIVLTAESIPGRGNSLNPFITIDGATAFIAFAEEVFGATEVAKARTPTPSGRLIHAELQVGDALLLLADTQEGWTALPGLFQVWVEDVVEVIGRATEREAKVITPPTPFYGSLTPYSTPSTDS